MKKEGHLYQQFCDNGKSMKTEWFGYLLGRLPTNNRFIVSDYCSEVLDPESLGQEKKNLE